MRLRLRPGRLPLRLLIAIALAFVVSACATVKPYQREYLSRRSMTHDRTAGESRFAHHSRGAREGAAGGTGEAGGGCGCN